MMENFLWFLTGCFGGATAMIWFCIWFGASPHFMWKNDWHCTASHREGPEHDQHDVCDRYERKDTK